MRVQPARRISRVAIGAALSFALVAMSSWGPVQAQAVSPVRDVELSSTQPGTAEAFYEADLGAKVSGFVSELNVDIGARVTAGQVLARIAVPELVQARNAARAKVVALQSQHDRTALLVARSSMTQRALEEAKSRLDTAVAEQAEIEAQMQYAVIEAPFAGLVTARTIDPGDMVYEANSPKGSDQPLLRVAKVDVIRVKTYVPETAAGQVDVGNPATVVFDALPGRTFSSQVARVSGALDPGTRTMLVEIDLANDDGQIRPGYYGQARIVLEPRADASAPP